MATFFPLIAISATALSVSSLWRMREAWYLLSNVSVAKLSPITPVILEIAPAAVPTVEPTKVKTPVATPSANSIGPSIAP